MGLDKLSSSRLLALVVCGALNLPPLLKSSNNILVFPADLMAQTTNSAVLAAGLQSENSKGLRNNDSLLLIIRRRNTFKDLQSLHGSGTTGGLVGNHATYSLVEDTRGSSEVERTSSSRVESGNLAKVGMVLQLRAEEFAGDVERFTSHYHDLLTVEQLLRDNTGQATQEVSFAINNDNWLEGGHPALVTELHS